MKPKPKPSQSKRRKLVCANCGKPATCIGAYEGSKAEEPACDECCGRGNEDGHCRQIQMPKQRNLTGHSQRRKLAKAIADMLFEDDDDGKKIEYLVRFRSNGVSIGRWM